MSRQATIRQPDRGSRGRTALVAMSLVAIIGCVWSWTAAAATTDDVTVTSTVGSVLSVQDTCSSAISISITLNTYQGATCGFQFGSSNDSTTTLRISSSAGPLLAGGAFPDHVGGCGALTGDSVGAKISTTGAGVTAALGCTMSGSATNSDFVGVPDAFASACTGTNLGVTANECELAVGIRESGGDATAGTYVGTIDVDVIG